MLRVTERAREPRRNTIRKKIMALLMGLCTTLLVMGMMPGTANAADDDNDGIPNKFESSGWWNTGNGYSGGVLNWTDINYPTACNTDSTAPAFQAVIVYPNTLSGSDVETNAEKIEFRRFVSRAESIFAASAQKVLNTEADVKQARTPRWNTFVDSSGKCAPAIMRSAIPESKFPQGCEIVNGTTQCNASEGDVSATDFFNYMQSLGYNRNDRKYIYFTQNPNDPGWGGVAQGRGYCDTTKTVSNCSNSGSHLEVHRGSIYSGQNYWGDESKAKNSATTLAHEIGHSIGMTGANSPDKNPQNGSHSADCWDVMCYSGLSAPAGQTYDNGCGGSSAENSVYAHRMDCNRDGQFHPNPTSGYLTTHWNPANNVFLWGGFTLSPTQAQARPTTQPQVRDDEIVYEDEHHTGADQSHLAHEHEAKQAIVKSLRDLLPLV